MRLLQPHILDDWPLMLARARGNRPPSITRGQPLADATKAALLSYTRAIGPLETGDTRRVSTTINDVMAINEHAVNGGRRVVLIDGSSTLGKTQAVVSHALKAADHVWSTTGRRVEGTEVIPFAYIEASSSGQGRSLLQSILRFANLPFAPSESADESLMRLRTLAPQLGLQAVIVDDAHMLRTVNTESRRLTDFLKTAITSLPFTFVFVGAGLDESALLRQSTRGGYSAAEQISRRATILRLAPWAETDTNWQRLLASLEQKLVIPHGLRRGTLTARTTSRVLHARSAGHPGMAVDWIKDAACAAIRHDRALTAEVLLATQPPKPTRAL